MLKKIFILIVLFLSTSFFIVYADETCTQGTDCLESINENTYNIEQSLSDLNDWLGVGSTDPSSFILFDDFNSSMTDFVQILGIFMGFSLFSFGFYHLGLFLYNKR